MSMRKKYEGSFLTLSARTCTVQIYVESDTAFTVQDLDFPADTPLRIEWYDKAVEEPLCGSSATLRVISPGDRTFLDMYTATPGTIRMDVLLDNNLYWSGLIDTEFYQEPYVSKNNYDVSFTFSDFGILERLKYNLSGIQTAEAVLTDALTRSGINYLSVSQSLISTYAGETRATLSQLSVLSDNFFDEEGEASTLKEALEGLFRPLSLKMIQRNGVIYVFDINALATANSSGSTSFHDSGVLGVDSVYNNARVIFSQYASGGEISDKLECEGDFTGHDTVNTANFTDSGDFYTYLIEKQFVNGSGGTSGLSKGDLSFNIWPVSNATGMASIASGTKYFHIQPLSEGDETEGVINWFYTGGHYSTNPTGTKKVTTLSESAVLMKTNRIYLPPRNTGASSASYLIRIVQSLLCDDRYNFYEDHQEDDSIYKDLNKHVTRVKIPVEIRLYNSSGTVLYHYENVDGRQAIQTQRTSLEKSLGGWVSGDVSTANKCMLEWWVDGDGCPIFGWKDNRQYYEGHRTESLSRVGSGQYLRYPNGGGYLEIRVLAGVTFERNDNGTSADVKSKIRWMLYKAPEVTVVNYDPALSRLDDSDIEYTGTLLPSAKESIEIGTICGSCGKAMPTARGLLFGPDGKPVDTMTRQGRTTSPEQLLIGTLYSHYGSRHMTLSGVAAMHDGGVGWYADPASPGVKLMPVAMSQDVREEEENVTFTEINADEYIAE